MRAIALLGAIVVLLIAGLLGMHALGGSAAGHGSSAAVHAGSSALGAVAHDATAAAPHHAQGHEAATAANAMQCSSTCQDEGPLAPGHAEMMACVLALLVGLIVLMAPARLARWWMPSVAPRAPADASAVLLAPPRPSLTLLSISRT